MKEEIGKEAAKVLIKWNDIKILENFSLKLEKVSMKLLNILTDKNKLKRYNLK